MSENPRLYHERLILKNFTVFSEAELEFAPGVNAFIGENGTGKTHILKALFASQLSWQRNDKFQSFEQTFQVDTTSHLLRIEAGPAATGYLSGVFGAQSWGLGMKHSNPNAWTVAGQPNNGDTPVFIPAIDMMGHTKGFVSTYDNFKIDFDLTHREIVSLLLSPERRELPVVAQEVVSALESVLGGSVELDGERFYLKSKQGMLPMPSVAEGLRKIATLIRLIQGGWIGPGSTLFWDEPEVNLNPVLMDEVIGSILTLARSGVQVFLATHSYVILKELEVQATSKDSVRFFALAPADSGTKVSVSESYLGLHPNKIEEQYGDLYDRRIEKRSRGVRAG